MRYRYWLTVISMCLLLQTQAQRYQFKTYSLADGVPQSQVFDIMNDSRGFLWLGTRGGGIARFDGRNFRNFQTVDGLINNFVNCLYEDKAGQIWVGTQSGISVYNGRRFHNFRLSDTADVRVFAITQNDSSMWFGTSDGLYRMINQHLQKVDVPIPAVSLYITSFWCTSTSIFASSNHGLIELSRAEHAFKKVWTKRNGLSDNYIQCILPLGDSAAWLGTYGKGINKFDQGTISPVNIPDLPPNLIVYDLVHDENKNLWIASQQHGLFRWNETTGEVQQFTERSGLSNQHVRSVTTDRWGSLWIGTSGGGMNQFTGQLFTHFTRADGLSDNYVYAIGQDLNGTYWLGNGNKGLTHMLPGEMVNYTDSIWKNLKIKSMAQTKDSVWYFGTEGQGLLIKDTSGWHTFDRDDGLCGNYIKDIEIDSSGILFVATLDGGVSAIYPGTTPRIRNYQYRTSLPSNRVYTLHADKSGNCWFGTENKGFGRFQNGKVTMTRSGQDLAYQSVRAIRSDKRNSIWLATSNGLYHYKPTEDTLIRINPRLMQSTNLYLLEFDLNGQLYVGHERGLDVLTLNESGEVIEVERFGAQEGFRGIETCQNAALCDRDGMLWFGTINGLTRYNPNRTERRSLPPSVYLESVDLFYEQLDSGRFGYQPTFWDQMASIPVFPYDQNHFGFSLNGIHLTEPGRLNYQWKLVG
ncbi:MAG: hypothetical protein H6608_10735, partial [Flavobacteriales bacterium]|nr:hypothetical protein [Flavobacteriales bacterium]